MIRGVGTQAFTIIEILIVLAVTSAILVSALLLIGHQQQDTEFNQAIHDIQSQIDNIINNVASGYYASNENFECTAPGGLIKIDTVSPHSRGSNTDCIFVGRAIQFGLHGQHSHFNVYNLIGLQKNSSGQLATNLDELQPVALTYEPSQPASTYIASSSVDTTERDTLLYGLTADTMSYVALNPPPPGGNTGVVAFISSLGSYNGPDLNSGSQTVGLYVADGTAIDNDEATAVNQIDYNQLPTPHSNLIQASHVDICFTGGTDKKAVITIGSNNRQLSTTLSVGSAPCP